MLLDDDSFDDIVFDTSRARNQSVIPKDDTNFDDLNLELDLDVTPIGSKINALQVPSRLQSTAVNGRTPAAMAPQPATFDDDDDSEEDWDAPPVAAIAKLTRVAPLGLTGALSASSDKLVQLMRSRIQEFNTKAGDDDGQDALVLSDEEGEEEMDEEAMRENVELESKALQFLAQIASSEELSFIFSSPSPPSPSHHLPSSPFHFHLRPELMRKW